MIVTLLGDKIPDFWEFVRNLDDYCVLNVQNAYASKSLTLHQKRENILTYKYVCMYGGVTENNCEGYVAIDKDNKVLEVQIIMYHLKSMCFRRIASEFFENAVMYPHLPMLKRLSLHTLKFGLFPN